jgi:hypothetical protein
VKHEGDAYETIRPYKALGYEMRVWRNVNRASWIDLVKMIPDADIIDTFRILAQVERDTADKIKPSEIWAVLRDLPGMAALEIVEPTTKAGGVFYKDWP